jgi:hypothetical protein
MTARERYEATREWFESFMATEYEPTFIHSPRREADELVASAAGQTTHVAKLRRKRAGTLRTQATKHENFVALVRRLGDEEEAATRMP